MQALSGSAGLAALRDSMSGLRPGERGLTVLTGAGISTECGVPDFRSPGSPWLTHAPIGFKEWLSDPAIRAEAWRRKFAMDDIYRHATPGRSHRALAELAQAGLIQAVITQNIDGLHHASGLDPDLLVELHGNGTFARCLTCGTRMELAAARACLEATGEAPVCACGGLVKSATIAFGQALDPAVMQAAFEATSRCDVFLAIGSSLVVRPAANLPLLAKAQGGRLVIVNREGTPLDASADLVVRAEASDALSEIARCASEQHVSSFDVRQVSGR